METKWYQALIIKLCSQSEKDGFVLNRTQETTCFGDLIAAALKKREIIMIAD